MFLDTRLRQMDTLLLLFLLFVSLLEQVLGTERCSHGGSNNTSPDIEELQEHGKCIQFDTSTSQLGTPCDSIYEEGVTYVYLSSRRAKGNLARYIDMFDDTQLFFDSRVPLRCLDEARAILCHYFLPPCGNETVFEPPSSVCEETCDYLRYLCPEEFEALTEYFRSREHILGRLGVTMINCSNTGEYIAPLDHCCSDLNIEIPCTMLNSSGDLVPDPECLRTKSVVVPSPSPSTDPSSPPGENDGSIGLTVGIAAAVVAMFVAIVMVALIIIAMRRRSTIHERGSQEHNKPNDRSESILRYHGENGLIPNPGATRVVARVTSGYIRQMADKELIIPASNLTLMDTIGQGEFGVVYRGTLTGWGPGNEQTLVAVKTLKGIFGTTDLGNMMEEGVKMARFNHPNVMRLIGVCIDKGASPYIVMPYMAYGSLLSYLKKHRVELTLVNDEDQALVTDTQTKLLSICLQVAKGMSYLATQQFVHRDLAARNCMIDERFLIKVADFGLSEDIYSRNYFRQADLQGSEGEVPVKLPVRWMAIESLHDGIFTEKTDVWSYGITMWEVFSLGRIPYPGVDPISLFQFLDDGGRLGKPANAACSHDVYTLMCECWTNDSNMRPNFSSFVSTISTMLEAIVGYLDLTTPVSPLSSCNHSVTTNRLNPMQVNSYPAVIVTDEDTH